MASDTSILFYGCGHLAGDTVAVAIGGIDMGDYTVADDGTLTVLFGADAQGIMTPQYLASIGNFGGDQWAPITFYVDDVLTTVVASVSIGVTYRSRGQTLRPALANDLGLRLSNGMGKVRRAHQFAALFHYVVKMDVGTDFAGTMDPVVLVEEDGETPWPASDAYTGVYRAILTDQYGYDSMLCWQVDRPVPAMVCAVSAFLEAEMRGDGA